MRMSDSAFGARQPQEMPIIDYYSKQDTIMLYSLFTVGNFDNCMRWATLN